MAAFPKEDLPPARPSGPSSDSEAKAEWQKIAARIALVAEPAADVSLVEDTPPAPLRDAKKEDDIQPQIVADMVSNRSLRETYADKAYSLACACLWGWGLMLFATGIVNGVRGNELWSDKVLIAVTTGVTVSVLAAFLGVIRGLFPNGQSKESQKAGK